VGVLGALLALALAGRVLAGVDGDVTVFAAFGEDAAATREYAEERLGDVFLRVKQGHDGKFFFVQANDPWLLQPEENALVLDRPLYRSQRMLYPVLAGGFGAFPPEVIVWAMLIVNILAMGVGTWAVALVAQEMGLSAWWGLAFGLNLGFISEMNIGGAGIVAAAAAFLAVAMFSRGRDGWGVALLAGAALSREAMLIAAVGAAFWLWRRSRRRAAMAAIGVPVALTAIWALYLRLRIEGEASVAQVEEIGLPFQGFIEAFAGWKRDPIDLVIGVVMMLLLVLFVRRVIISDNLVGWSFFGFAALAVVFTEQVWRSYFDITRAIAPVITAFVLLVFLGQARKPSERTRVRT
jgi:hypothetical protein